MIHSMDLGNISITIVIITLETLLMVYNMAKEHILTMVVIVFQASGKKEKYMKN